MSYKYRIFCKTEQSFIITNSNTTPTKCPNNDEHIIDPARTIKIEKNTVSIVQIKDEIPDGTPTSGHFKSIGFDTYITEETNTKDISWVYPISAMCIKFNMSNEHINDIIDVYIIPTINKGNTASKLNENDNKVYLTQDTFNSVTVGMQIFITDNNYTFFLGAITSKNENENAITVQNASDRDYNINAYINMKVPIAVNSSSINVGDFKINVNNKVYMNVGQVLSITDGINTDDLGEIFEINETENQIIIEKQCNNVYNPGSFIFPKLHVIKNFKINSAQTYTIGEKTLTGSYIKKFYVIRLVYRNASNTNKNFNWYVEYKY